MSNKTVIVPIDFSENSMEAFSQAHFFARIQNAKIVLVHVSQGENDAENKLKNIVKNHAAVNIDYKIEQGSVHKGIVKVAKDENAELIFIGTHGVSGFEKYFMGSTAFRIIGIAPCPVFSMRKASNNNQIKRIVMPIDTTPESRQKMRITAEFAKIYNASVNILGVSTDSDQATQNKLTILTDQVGEYLSNKNIRYEKEIIAGGNITDVTINYAVSKEADLIAIMTEQEVNIISFLMGKFAQQMVNRSPIPVLTCRTEDISANYNQKINV